MRWTGGGSCGGAKADWQQEVKGRMATGGGKNNSG